MATSYTERTEPSAPTYTGRTKPTTTYILDREQEGLWSRSTFPWLASILPWQLTAGLTATSYTERTKP